jgi:hypothetical protein
MPKKCKKKVARMSQKSRTSGGLADISNLNEQQLVEKTEEI